jgi:hypothetical protein
LTEDGRTRIVNEDLFVLAAGKGSELDLPPGVFAPWSNDPPDDDYRRVLARSFETVHVEVVTIHNPLQGCDSKNTVYVGAHRASKPAAA